MLYRHKDFSGTLIITADGTGGWHGQGDIDINLGYSIGNNPETATEGVWARWKWDGCRLVVSNDRFGFLPVFYALLPDGIGVSTSAMALVKAGANATLDDTAT
jgi:hypothetical protein